MIIHHIHKNWVRCVLVLFMLVCFSVSAHAEEQDEYSVFLSGFTAFQSQDYQGAASKMSHFLEQYPTTPLRDMALFWLARAHYHLGDKQEAARYLATFLKEYPNTPLRNAAEPELIALAQSYNEESDSFIPSSFQNPVGDPGLIALAQSSGQVSTSPIVSATEKSVVETNDQPAIVAAMPAVDEPVANSQPVRVAAAKPQVGGVVATPEMSVTQRDGTSLSMKERAIREYRKVLEKYPGTQAALNAAARLKELEGVSMAPAEAEGIVAESKSTAIPATTFTLEVGQFAAADLSLRSYPATCGAGAIFSVPFEVVNRGNGPDSFLLDAGFPAEFKPRIASLSDPDASLNSTPNLAPGERFDGMVFLTVPTTIVDGQRSVYPIKMVSQFDRDISVSKEIPLVFSAPLLRMFVRADKETVLPGETVTYKMALLNLGSATAKKVSFSVSYPSHYEPVGPLPAGLRRNGDSRISAYEMDVESGGRNEFNLAFRLKDDALAGQELFCKTQLNNAALKLTEAFVSSPVAVGRVSGVAVNVQNEKRTLLPGQKVVIPVSVSNRGNFRENISIKTSIPSSIRYAIYRNGGGSVKQAKEIVDGSINSLSPGEQALLRIELFAPVSVSDKTETSFTITCETASYGKASAIASVQLVYSRPVVTLEMESRNGRLKPGEIAHLVLSAVNHGSSMAKDVEVISSLPERIDVVALEPAALEGQKGKHLWRFSELGPGEKRSIVLAYRIKPGVTAGTSLQIENQFSYKDQQGNTY